MNKVSFIEARESIRNEILRNADLKAYITKFADVGAWYVPCAGNLGDGLIGLGTLDLFRHLGVSPPVCTGESGSELSCTKHLIVGGSGGWFEGKWDYYAKILTDFLDGGGNLLILPSTVRGFTDFFSKYAKQVVIFAREKTTFDHLTKIEGLKNRVFLSHDLAFMLNFSALDLGAQPSRAGELRIFRQDAESKGGLLFAENYDFPLIWSHEKWADRAFCLQKLRPVMELMQLFVSIRTDRLHMSILGAILGCRVSMYASSYFKNSAVYEHSLCRFDTVQFFDSPPTDGIRQADLTVIGQLHAEHDVAIERLELERRKCATLREQLHEMRLSLLKYEGEIDSNLNSIIDLKGKLENFQKENERLSTDLSAFQGSRGYRLWLAYNHLYEGRALGPTLRRLRRLVGSLLKCLRGRP